MEDGEPRGGERVGWGLEWEEKEVERLCKTMEEGGDGESGERG